MSQRDKVESRLAHFQGKCVAVPARSVAGMKVSHKQICVVLFHLSSESNSVFRLTPVLQFFWRCSHRFRFRIASRLTDDEWSVSEVGFSGVVCSQSSATLDSLSQRRLVAIFQPCKSGIEQDELVSWCSWRRSWCGSCAMCGMCLEKVVLSR